MLSKNEEHFEVRACITPANRAFLLVCPHCWASCRGQYGNSDKEESRQEARQALTKFVLDTDAAEGEEVRPRRQRTGAEAPRAGVHDVRWRVRQVFWEMTVTGDSLQAVNAKKPM